MNKDKRNNILAKYFYQKIFYQYKITKTDLCKKINCARSTLNNVLIGRSKLTISLATKISALFPDDENLSVDTLMKLQLEKAIDEIKEDSSSKTQYTSCSNEASPSFIPNIYKITSTNIERWVHDNPINSRSQLPVLLRRLVLSTLNSECIMECDFPGNDESQRHGPDGIVNCIKGNAFVPEGLSHWEFGVNKDFLSKIKSDFKSASSKHPESKTKEITYIAVTPWKISSEEIQKLTKEFNEEKIWKEVKIYDAKDIENWLEISFSGQLYFSEISKSKIKNIELLETYWNNFTELEFSSDTNNKINFKITEDFFENEITLNKNKIDSFFDDNFQRFLNISSESKEESLAFIYCLLKKRSLDGKNFLDNSACIFSSDNINNLIKVGLKAKLILITDSNSLLDTDIESLRKNFKVIIINSENDSIIGNSHNTDLDIYIRLYPLSTYDFENCLTRQNIPNSIVTLISNCSGNSISVLHYLYSVNKSIRRKKIEQNILSRNYGIKKALLALATVKGITIKNKEECNLIKRLSQINEDCMTYLDTFSYETNSLVRKEEQTLCVLSKYTIFTLLKDNITEDYIKGFFKVLNDIFLDKTKYALYSSRFRKTDDNRIFEQNILLELIDTLCLLSSKGNLLFCNQELSYYFYKEKNQFINKLFSNDNEITDYVTGESERQTTVRDDLKNRLIFLFPYLPLLAEASPETFIDFCSKDIKKEDSIIKEFIGLPYNYFPLSPEERTEYRCDILHALETIAWIPKYFEHAVLILNELSKVKINDNLLNTPFNSIYEIYRLNYPRTYAGYRIKINVLNKIVKKDSDFGYKFISAILNDAIIGTSFLIKETKPKWLSFGDYSEKSANQKEISNYTDNLIRLLFEITESCSQQQDNYIENLGKLIRYLRLMKDEERNYLLNRIKEAAENGSDRNKLELKKYLLDQIEYNSFEDIKNYLKKFLNSNRRIFEINDPLIKYGFLFTSSYLSKYDKSIDLSLFDGISGDDFDRQILNLRNKAIEDVYKSHGIEPIYDFIKNSPVSFFIGLALQNTDSSLYCRTEELITYTLYSLCKNDNENNCYNLTEFLRGLYWKSKRINLFKIIEDYCKENNKDLVTLLAKFPLSLKLYKHLKKQFIKKEEAAYWNKLLYIDLNTVDEKELNRVVNKLIEQERLEIFNLWNYSSLRKLTASQLFTLLIKAADIINTTKDHLKIKQIEQHSLLEIIEKVTKDNNVNFDEKCNIEIKYLPFIIKAKKQSCIKEIEILFENRPDLFAEFFKFSLDNLSSYSEQDKKRIIDNYFLRKDLLSLIQHIPGQVDNSNQINTTYLEQWINQVKEYSNINNLNIDMALGRILIHGPREEDILFPSYDICNIFENIANQPIADNLYLEIINGAGNPIVSRVDGGETQTAFKEKYESLKIKYPEGDFPYTYNLLCHICASYGNRADRERTEENLRRLGIYK